MPDSAPRLEFAIEGAEPECFAAVPTLLFALRIRAPGRTVRNLALRSQIRIDPTRRRYDAADEERLGELFGDPTRWGRTLRSFLWDHVDLSLPAFAEECAVQIPVACSYDFEVAATKYFRGLGEGAIPLSFLFSGSIFYDGPEGALRVGQVSWSKEVRFNLPVALWGALMARHHPDTTWLRVPNDVLERLARYRRRRGFTDWEQTLDSLIPRESPTAEAPGSGALEQTAGEAGS